MTLLEIHIGVIGDMLEITMAAKIIVNKKKDTDKYTHFLSVMRNSLK